MSIYSMFCLFVVGVFTYVTFTGRNFYNFGSDRAWTEPGKREIHYHK